nr:serine hydrolase domain-containing protein [Allomuricauda sp.]
MKRKFLCSALIVLLNLASCAVVEDEVVAESTYDCSLPNGVQNSEHPNHAKYQSLLDGIIRQGVPGIMMAVYSEKDGLAAWVGASGKADLKNNVDLKPCNITRVGSTVKMLTAVTILQLVEEGKLDLEDKAASYLTEESMRDIENARTATIRELLQHSSGIYNYIQSTHFQTASLNDLTKEWKPQELLDYARGRKANFRAGTDVDYSNTNYIFLGEIIEKVEGKPFYEVFQERIFHPLGLDFTSFAAVNPVPHNIIRGYIDLYSKLEVTDATHFSGWDYYTADGGLISNPRDLYLFLRAVVNLEIINKTHFDQMIDWISPSHDDEAFYGLGIFKIVTPFGDAYMHSGDAIGYYASMMYLPDHDIYISWAVNGNYGKIDEFTQSKEAMEHIIEKILE